MRGFLAWAGNALFGWRKGRPPINGPDDLHRYLDDLARRAGKPLPSQLAEGAKQVAVGVFEARQERRTRRRRARAARLERRAAAHPWELVADRSTIFDPLVSRVSAYLFTFGAFVTILESTGTYASLGVFDGVLGEFRGWLAVASGAILFLGGHACGHLLFAAVRARELTKKVLFATVAALVLAAIVAICWTGLDRSANEEARAKAGQASAIGDQAYRLEATAARLEAPKPSGEAAAERPSKAALAKAGQVRGRAADLRQRAAEIEREGLEGRSLDFLAGIQLVGLVVGIAGGWLFSEATPVRIARMRSRAERLRTQVNSIVRDEAGAAGAAYGHFQAELAIAGVNVSEHGSPDFEVDRRLLHERFTVVPAGGNGRVSQHETTGGEP